MKNVDPAVDFINPPPYEAGPPTEPRSSWTYKPKHLSAAATTAVARLEEMTDLEGLQASDLLTAFVTRRVLPLRGQPHMIC